MIKKVKVFILTFFFAIIVMVIGYEKVTTNIIFTWSSSFDFSDFCPVFYETP